MAREAPLKTRYAALLGMLSFAASVDAACVDVPSHQRFAGGFATGSTITRLASSGSLLLYGTTYEGRLGSVVIRDVGAAARFVSSFDAGAPVTGLAIDGTLAHVAVSGCDKYGCRYRILTTDLSDPETPVALGELDLEDHANDLAQLGTWLYVIVNGDLLVVDASDPLAPVAAGDAMVPGDAFAVDVVGDVLVVRAEVTANTHALVVFDAVDPAAPSEVGTLSPLPPIWDLAAGEATAYLAHGSGGVRVVDLADPSDPGIVGTWLEPATDVAMLGAELIAIGGGTVRRVDGTDPAQPLVTARLPLPEGLSLYDVAVVDQRPVARGDWGSYVSMVLELALDGDPLPTPHATLDVGGFAGSVVDLDGTVFVSGRTDGLRSVDWSSPDDPVILATIPIGDVRDLVHLEGPLILAAIADVGLGVVDVTDPAAPVVTSTLALPTSPRSIDVDGGLAYVGGGGSLHVVDVAVPATLVLHASTALSPGSGNGVDVTDGVAVVTGGNWLDVVDVTDPASPLVTDSMRLFEASSPVNLGPVTFVSLINSLQAIDTASPGSASPLWNLGGAFHEAHGLTLAGHHLYAGGDTGIQIFDVSDESAPRAVGLLPTDTPARFLTVAEERVYASGGFDGRITLLDAACDVTIGVGVEPVMPARTPWVHPNPSRVGSRVWIDARSTTPVTVRVLDVTGRRIASLANGKRLPHGGSLVWDGTNVTGQAVAPGVYFVQVESRQSVVTERITLLAR